MSYKSRIKLTQGADESYPAKFNCSAADPLVKMILTLKGNVEDADPGVLQKKITTSLVSGVGQITADGSLTSGAAVGRFDFTSAELAALAARQYVYDIKVITAASLKYPAAQGRCELIQQTTTSTS